MFRSLKAIFCLLYYLLNLRGSSLLLTPLLVNPRILPALLPIEDSLPSYGDEQINKLAEFYGKEAKVQCAAMTYTPPPSLHDDELLSEWKIFRCALILENKAIMECTKWVSASLQHILDEIETSHTYTCMEEFPQDMEATEHHDGISCRHSIY